MAPVPEHVLRAVREELLTQVGGDDAPEYARDGADLAARQALKAGAVPPLDYKGLGATGVVVCDARGHAFKVARDARAVPTLADEADWLNTAAEVPGVREHVAGGAHWYPELGVIERECVQGERVPWRYPLYDLHETIGKKMRSVGWGAPEFKSDSYVMTEDRGPVLVDAGFVTRFGDRLTDYVTDVLDGRRPWGDDDPSHLAWALRWDNEEPRSPRVESLLERLYALGATR